MYDVSTLIILYVCKLAQFGCTLMFKRVDIGHVDPFIHLQTS